MPTFDLYGYRNQNLEAIRLALQHALGVKLQAHESSFIGEYFRLQNSVGEEFQLQRNFDPYEEEWAEDDFPDMHILLYINNTERAEELERLIAERIPELFLLRRQRI